MELHGEDEFLIEKIIPKAVITSLVGNSEAGKTQFALQLAIAIAKQDQTFMGLKLKPTHGKVIIICTEDGKRSIRTRLKNLISIDDPAISRIDFILDLTEDPIHLLKQHIEQNPIDLLIVDNWFDYFEGDPNRSVDVRHFMTPYKQLAEQSGAAITFLHHFNKTGMGSEPNKKYILGSQGFEAAMRSVFSLEYAKETDQRVLRIIKGNMLAETDKRNFKIIMKISDGWKFELQDGLQAHHLGADNKRESVEQILRQNSLWNIPVRKLESVLQEDYRISAGKSMIAEIVKAIKKDQNLGPNEKDLQSKS